MQHARSLAESRGRRKTEPQRRSSLVGKMPSTYLTASLPLSLEFVIFSAFSRSSVTHTHPRRRRATAACFWGVSRRKSLFDGEIRTVALPPALSS